MRGKDSSQNEFIQQMGRLATEKKIYMYIATCVVCTAQPMTVPVIALHQRDGHDFPRGVVPIVSCQPVSFF